MHSILVKRIEALTHSRLVTINADATLIEAAHFLSNTRISLIVVCDSLGVMVGVITKTNIVQQIALSCMNIGTTLAADVMIKEVVACRLSDSLVDVLSMMEKSSFVHIPVVDEHAKPVGVVNAGDAMRALMADEKYESALLRNYVMGIGYR